MSHEGGSDSTQRTVAELLAKYGGSTGERAPRRRRHRADDPSDTGAQAIIERVLSESGEMAAIREDQPPPERVSHRSRPQPPRPHTAPRPSGNHAAPQPTGNHAVAPPQHPPTPRRQRPEPPREARPVQPPMPAIAQSAEPTTPVRSSRPPQVPPGRRPGQATGQHPVGPPSLRNVPAVGERRPGPPPPAALARSRPGPPVDAATEEMPRIGLPDQYAADRTPHVAPDEHPVGVLDRTAIAEPGRRYPGYPDADEQDLDEFEADLDEDADEFVDDEPDAADERAVSPVREWLMMAGQIALGVLGGAVVFLGFNWLWREFPAAALVAALVAIVALVLVVRKIRRADDLQSTVFAVLVGLFVTVSPAALLLLGR